MEMFAEIIKNMFGVSLSEFTVQLIDSILYLVTSVLVIIALFKLFKITKSRNAKGSLIFIFASFVSSFVSLSVIENSESVGGLEMSVILLPSLFILVSAVCFYRFSNELGVKSS